MDSTQNLGSDGGGPRESSQRELSVVPGNYPGARIRHHALVAELGGVITRHREFLQFHNDRVYPAYLLAYHRCIRDPRLGPDLKKV